MKKMLISLISALSVAGVSIPTFADTPVTTTTPPAASSPSAVGHGQGRFHRFKEMTPEQRKARRAEVKQKWNSLSPQEQAAFKEKNKDRLKKMRGKSNEGNVLRLYGAEIYKN